MDCEPTRWLTNSEFMKRLTDRAHSERIPLSGGVDLTSRCNLKCLHCYIESPGGRRRYPLNALSTDRLLSILDEVAAAGCLFFLLTGGEPLTHPDFVRVYRHAKRRGLIVSLFTNGTLVDHEIVALLQELPPWSVEISLYGATRETYEAITRVPGSFDACMRGIQLLHDGGISLRLKTMLLEQNKHEFAAIRQFAHDLGVRFRFDSGVTPTLCGEKHTLACRLPPEEIVQVEFEDDDVAADWVRFRKQFREAVGDPNRLYQCGSGYSTFHIDSNGHLLPCMMSRDITFDLKKGSFETGWREVIPEVQRLAPDPDLPCTTCELLGLCGYCPPALSMESGDGARAPEYMCRLAQARLDGIDEWSKQEKRVESGRSE